jgi:hypothetical protein
MSWTRFLYCLSTLLIIFISPLKAGDLHKEYLLSEALKERRVNLCAEGLGGYSKKCLFVTIKNTTSLPIHITVDPAMIFRPVDSNQQDLVTAGSEYVVLAPLESKSISLNAFCGKSYARAPSRNTKFVFLKQGNKAFVEAMRFISKNKLFNSIGQAAVWSFTNNKSLSAIYNPDQSEISNQLIKLIAKLTNKPIPQYYIIHKNKDNPNGAVYNPHISRLYVELNWQNPSNSNLHIYVYQQDGSLYKEIIDGEHITNKGHSIKVVFDPEKDPKGLYTVCVKDNFNFVYQSKLVRVDKEE